MATEKSGLNVNAGVQGGAESEYAIEIKDEDGNIQLSNEHKEYKWVEYEEALKKLKYDSNKTALWELNEKLNKRTKVYN